MVWRLVRSGLRRQARSVEFSGGVTSLITAWLEVRVLPGPPSNKFNSLARLLATLAAWFGDSLFGLKTAEDKAFFRDYLEKGEKERAAIRRMAKALDQP